MKRRVLVGCMVIGLLAVAMSLSAQVHYYVNQATVAWDAPTGLSDGSPVPSGDRISYEVFRRKLPTGTEQLVGEVSATQTTITFTVEGDYAIGVRTKRVTIDGLTVYSDTVWSDLSGVPNPWMIEYLVPPKTVGGLKVTP